MGTYVIHCGNVTGVEVFVAGALVVIALILNTRIKNQCIFKWELFLLLLKLRNKFSELVVIFV